MEEGIDKGIRAREVVKSRRRKGIQWINGRVRVRRVGRFTDKLKARWGWLEKGIEFRKRNVVVGRGDVQRGARLGIGQAIGLAQGPVASSELGPSGLTGGGSQR